MFKIITIFFILFNSYYCLGSDRFIPFKISPWRQHHDVFNWMLLCKKDEILNILPKDIICYIRDILSKENELTLDSLEKIKDVKIKPWASCDEDEWYVYKGEGTWICENDLQRCLACCKCFRPINMFEKDVLDNLNHKHQCPRLESFILLQKKLHLKNFGVSTLYFISYFNILKHFMEFTGINKNSLFAYLFVIPTTYFATYFFIKHYCLHSFKLELDQCNKITRRGKIKNNINSDHFFGPKYVFSGLVCAGIISDLIFVFYP